MTHAAALLLPTTAQGYAWIYVYPVVIILWCVLWIARPWHWRGLLVLVPTVAAYVLARDGWGNIPSQISLAIAQAAVLGFAAMSLRAKWPERAVGRHGDDMQATSGPTLMRVKSLNEVTPEQGTAEWPQWGNNWSPVVPILSALWCFQSLYFFLYAIDVHRHYELWVYGLNKWVPMAAVTVGFAYLAYRLRYATLPHQN